MLTFFFYSSVVYGEESKYYEGEKIPKLKHNKPGLLSMVNYGNNMYVFLHFYKIVKSITDDFVSGNNVRCSLEQLFPTFNNTLISYHFWCDSLIS